MAAAKKEMEKIDEAAAKEEDAAAVKEEDAVGTKEEVKNKRREESVEEKKKRRDEDNKIKKEKKAMLALAKQSEREEEKKRLELKEAEKKAAEKRKAEKKAAERGQTGRASQILIKYADKTHSRTSSYKDPNGIIIGQRTRQDAETLLMELRNRVISNTATFAELAMEYSDCTSGKKGGDRDIFERNEDGQYDAEFCETIFDLKVGEISGVIHNKSGAYIMMRTA